MSDLVYHSDLDKQLNGIGIKCNFSLVKKSTLKDINVIAITIIDAATDIKNIIEQCEPKTLQRIYCAADICPKLSAENVEILKYNFAKDSDKWVLPYLSLFNFKNNNYICSTIAGPIKNLLNTMKIANSAFYCELDEAQLRDWPHFAITANYVADPTKLNLDVNILRGDYSECLGKLANTIRAQTNILGRPPTYKFVRELQQLHPKLKWSGENIGSENQISGARQFQKMDIGEYKVSLDNYINKLETLYNAPNINKLRHKLPYKLYTNYTLVVVPYANFFPEEKRDAQLQQFIAHFKTLNPPSELAIVVAEQIKPKKYFNRGQLLNAGIKWFAEKYGEPKYIILHDVDMLPDSILFREYFTRMSPTSFVPYDDDFKSIYFAKRLGPGGGIFGIAFKNYIDINGYPNTFWSWGGEDNALEKRMEQFGIACDYVDRGTIKHIDIQRTTHKNKMDYLKKKNIRSMMVHENLAKDVSNWKFDGISNVLAKIKSVRSEDFIHHVQFQLDNANLNETIKHNAKVYKKIR